MMPRGAWRTSTSMVAHFAAAAQRPVPSTSNGAVHKTQVRRRSIPGIRCARLSMDSIMVIHGDFEEGAAGTGLIQRWIVIGAAVGCRIERRQPVGDIGDGGGHP